jgi:4'-phosphopantetheinyl transferase
MQTLIAIPKKGVKIGLWKIEEDEDFFRSKMPLSIEEEADLAPLKQMRRLEWLACRWLLHEISGHDIRMPLVKDAFSKPFFEDASEKRYCSLTHASGYVGAVISQVPCGCDLEVLAERLNRVSSKFVNENEERILTNPRFYTSKLWRLCFIWCAKEAIYKAYGEKSVDFKKNMTIIYNQNIGVKGELGILHKEEFSNIYELNYMNFKDGDLKFIFLWSLLIYTEKNEH